MGPPYPTEAPYPRQDPWYTHEELRHSESVQTPSQFNQSFAPLGQGFPQGLSQGSVPGPPLPTRPPQSIVDHHIPRQQMLSTPPRSRLTGPRDRHSLVSSPSDPPGRQYGSPGVAHQSSPATPYQNIPYQNIAYQHSPSLQNQLMSSPLSVNSSPGGPRQMHSSYINGYSTSSSPLYQRNPSPKRSDVRPVLNVSVENSLMDSPISALPDIPVLTPVFSVDSLVDSPRSQLYGPRQMSSGGGSFRKTYSPSASPGKTGYYDHRTSWKSEYSVNLMDFEGDNEEQYLTEEPIRVLSPMEEEHTPMFNAKFDLGSIDIPELGDPVGPTDKQLPQLPQAGEFLLPSLPFSARSLTDIQFSQCSTIFLVSDVFQWSVNLSLQWSEGLLITRDEYKKSLKLLFKYKSPTMNSYVIDSNIEALVLSFERQNAIYVNSENIIHFFDNVKVTGVFPQLTGCYSRAHEIVSPYQCPSCRCSLTIYQPPIPTMRVQEAPVNKLGEWASHWNLSKLDLEDLDDDEVQKQSHIFELIRQQQSMIRLGEIQVKEYGQSFKSTQPQLLPDISKFYNDAFNSVKPLIELHKRHLFEPLITKLNTQGKYISGIGEIFLEWGRQATVPYLKYTESLASVRELIKFEKNRQSRFAEWLYDIDQRPDVVAASLDHSRIFFSGFIGHTQLLSLALRSVQKKTAPSDIDHALLGKAVEEVDKLNRKIDGMQESALQRRQLKFLARQLLWKSTVLETDLKMKESMRRLVKKADVTRKDKWTSSPNCVILLDNYLLITEEQKDTNYRIVEKPIPVEFLQFETRDLTTDTSSETERFPFKIRYTGQNLSFTFSTDSSAERDAWFVAYNQVKAKKSKGQDFEPFRITVLSDQFGYEEGQQPQKLPVCVKGSNIDVVLTAHKKAMETGLEGLSMSRPIMMSELLSGATFSFEGKTYRALGLQFGLYFTEDGAHQGWKRVLDLSRITQIEKLDNLLVVLSDKALYYFNIVSLLLNYYDMNADGKVVGERLSKRDVAFFKIGSYYNTKLLFLMKTPLQTLGPRFKVFTPIFDSFGTFQYFQLYKRFQHSTDCFDISIFNSMFVLHTVKGFEILSFQVMYESQPIPKFLTNLKKPKSELEMIKKKLKSGSAKPLLMMKVPLKPQFYLVYDSFAIVIDTIGQLVNDSFIFPFKFRCTNATLQGKYLICIGDDIVEVFDLSYDDVLGFQKFEPVQIITGKNINLIDSVDATLTMAHPTIPGRQLALNLDLI